MTIEIQKKESEETYTVSYISRSGKKKTSGIVGFIHEVGSHFVFMVDGKPTNVLNKLHDMDTILLNSFKVRPSYVNLIF